MEKDMRTICRRNCGLCRRSEIAQYVSEPGFSIKQLRDYVENWIGLIRANEHLKESKRLQAERIKVLTDVCSCLSAIGEIIDKETQAQ